MRTYKEIIQNLDGASKAKLVEALTLHKEEIVEMLIKTVDGNSIPRLQGKAAMLESLIKIIESKND